MFHETIEHDSARDYPTVTPVHDGPPGGLFTVREPDGRELGTGDAATSLALVLAALDRREAAAAALQDPA